MTQEELDKIVICRSAIDKYRTFKTAFDKDRIEASLVSKTMSEGDRSSATNEMNEVLMKQGFVNESNGLGSATVFKAWHDKVMLELFKECYPIEGSCDKCAGLPEAGCVKAYPKQNCYSSKEAQLTPEEFQYQEAYRARQTGKYTVEKGHMLINCPYGHGFYVEESKVKEPLDFGWSM